MFELALLGSPADIMVVMVVALLVFGPKQLPEVGRQVGQFIREGRKMMSTFTDALNDDHHDNVRTPFSDQTVRGEMSKDPEPDQAHAQITEIKPEIETSEIGDHASVEAEPVTEPLDELKSVTSDKKLN